MLLLYNELQKGQKMNNTPIDYEKSIEDTVKKIADFYLNVLKKKAGDMSVEQHNRLMNAANSLVECTKQPRFYENYGWGRFDFVDLFLLNQSVRGAVEDFFCCAQEYKSRKYINGGKYLEQEEGNLANAIKRVNIKFGNEFLAIFKDWFVDPKRFLAHFQSEKIYK